MKRHSCDRAFALEAASSMPASSRKLKRAPKRMARSTRSGSATQHKALKLHVLLASVCTAARCAAPGPKDF